MGCDIIIFPNIDDVFIFPEYLEIGFLLVSMLVLVTLETY